MNKYTETIQESLESEHSLGHILADLHNEFQNIPLWLWYKPGRKIDNLMTDWDLKLSYLYLLSIVDQETADEMIELLKEPV